MIIISLRGWIVFCRKICFPIFIVKLQIRGIIFFNFNRRKSGLLRWTGWSPCWNVILKLQRVQSQCLKIVQGSHVTKWFLGPHRIYECETFWIMDGYPHIWENNRFKLILKPSILVFWKWNLCMNQIFINNLWKSGWHIWNEMKWIIEKSPVFENQNQYWNLKETHIFEIWAEN